MSSKWSRALSERVLHHMCSLVGRGVWLAVIFDSVQRKESISESRSVFSSRDALVVCGPKLPG